MGVLFWEVEFATHIHVRNTFGQRSTQHRVVRPSIVLDGEWRIRINSREKHVVFLEHVILQVKANNFAIRYFRNNN